MTTFTIDCDGNITAFASQKEALAADIAGAEHFGSREELAKLAAAWPGSRLVEIWNGLPGVAPVKKFTDRKTAVARIWKAAQALTRPVRPRAPRTRRRARGRGRRPPGARRPPLPKRAASKPARAAKRPRCWSCSAGPKAPHYRRL